MKTVTTTLALFLLSIVHGVWAQSMAGDIRDCLGLAQPEFSACMDVVAPEVAAPTEIEIRECMNFCGPASDDCVADEINRRMRQSAACRGLPPGPEREQCVTQLFRSPGNCGIQQQNCVVNCLKVL